MSRPRPEPGREASVAGPRTRVRLFRADTPHDVAGACLVAGQAPARDYLAISCDKAAAERDEYQLVMRALAGSHAWAGIVDISNLPINRHDWLVRTARASRRRRYRDLRSSLRVLREAVGSCVAPEAIDDLFLTCLDHPDVQLLAQLLPAAEISYLPHGLGSIHAAENEACARWAAPPSLARRARRAVTDLPKRALWGPAAAPPLHLEVGDAYTFHRRPAFGRRRHDLAHLITAGAMARLFDALPDDARSAYRELAGGTAASTGLLLLTPGDGIRRRDYPHDRELEGFGELASALVESRGVGRVVVKPHPRNSRGWIAKMTDAVRAAVPGASVVAATRFPAVPIEIAACPMDLVAGAAIGSSSLQTLSRIYGIPTYSSDRLLRELHAGNPRMARRIETWIEDNRDYYTAV